MGQIPNDIVNIVRYMIMFNNLEQLNRNYREVFESTNHGFGVCFRHRDINKRYFMNSRDIIGEKYRKEIVCFLTDEKTKYCVPKDIINIVISMKSKEEKRRLNRNYYDKYAIYDAHFRYGIYFYYKKYDGSFDSYNINYRDIRKEYYRTEIVCFLTDKKTKYKVPKNY